MPQDFETILRGSGSGGDERKGRVTCETLLNSSNNNDLDDPTPLPPDFPPESYYIAKEDERDYFDRNVFFDRKESINKTSFSNPSPNTKSRSHAKSSKPSIIGLPKPQRCSFPDSKSRRCSKPLNTRFFPKRLGSGGKFSLRMSEPSSPKVSCMGKVRSRNRNRCRRSLEKKKPASPTEKPGFWLSFKKIFGLNCWKNQTVDANGPSENSISPEKKENVGIGFDEEPGQKTGFAPGLGGMNRFVSGRRTNSWAGEALTLSREQGDSDSDRCEWGPTTAGTMRK